MLLLIGGGACGLQRKWHGAAEAGQAGSGAKADGDTDHAVPAARPTSKSKPKVLPADACPEPVSSHPFTYFF